jgi:hypothetical protein
MLTGLNPPIPEDAMIVVRNTFRIKFGQARPAIAAFKEILALNAKLGVGAKTRLLSDLTGTSYTLVFEVEFNSLGDWENQSMTIMGSDEWRATYEKFVPYAEGGSREIFNVVA